MNSGPSEIESLFPLASMISTLLHVSIDDERWKAEANSFPHHCAGSPMIFVASIAIVMSARSVGVRRVRSPTIELVPIASSVAVPCPSQKGIPRLIPLVSPQSAPKVSSQSLLVRS